MRPNDFLNHLNEMQARIESIQQRVEAGLPEDHALIAGLLEDALTAFEAMRSGDEELEDRARKRVGTLTATNRRLEQEVAERQRATDALHETEQRLRMMIESATDFAIFSLDLEGYFTSWNTGAERVFGFREEDVVGKSGAILFTPEDRARGVPEKELATALATGYASDDRWHVRNDGSRLFVTGATQPMLDPAGNPRGFVKIARDITAQKAAEEDRARLLTREQQARADAERANAAQRQFLAMVSHELRTPLASIKGFSSTLLAEDVTFSTEQQRQFIEVIDEEANRLDDLIGQLLDVARIEAGTLRVNPQVESVPGIIEFVRARMAVLTALHRFTIELPATLPLVMADRQRVAQVLLNLVHNAAKYSPDQTLIRVSAFATDGVVQIDVCDEGPGIPPEVRSTMFQVFRQGTQAVKQMGVGLGLAICKGLVEAHGGRIWIQDQPPPGTTISFTLPMADVGTEPDTRSPA